MGTTKDSSGPSPSGPAPCNDQQQANGIVETASEHQLTNSGLALADEEEEELAEDEVQLANDAMRERWRSADAELCKHSLSFHLQHALRSDFFASYLYLVAQIPLVKLFPLTCEFQDGEKTFYFRAQKFYENVPDTEEGMMGDFLEVSQIDLDGSANFLKKFMGPGGVGSSLALDCGSGIGRVSRSVLLPMFQEVELVDQEERFLVSAHQNFLGDEADRVRTLYCYKLQEFSPDAKKYDLVWMQWVACHLTDRDLVHFLVRCRRSLRPRGLIVLKDNMARRGAKLDISDSSVSRHLDVLRVIIAAAGLTIVDVARQHGFPDDAMPIWMVAMR